LAFITVEEWNEFYKEYTMQFLAQPDYRLGQAFCNKFDVTGVLDKTYLLFYETSNEKAWDIIKNYIDGEVNGPFSK